MKYLLILIYSTVIITAEPKKNIKQCLAEAKARLGEEYKTIWNDNNAIDAEGKPVGPPKIIMSYCVQGSVVPK